MNLELITLTEDKMFFGLYTDPPQYAEFLEKESSISYDSH